MRSAFHIVVVPAAAGVQVLAASPRRRRVRISMIPSSVPPGAAFNLEVGVAPGNTLLASTLDSFVIYHSNGTVSLNAWVVGTNTNATGGSPNLEFDRPLDHEGSLAGLAWSAFSLLVGCRICVEEWFDD